MGRSDDARDAKVVADKTGCKVTVAEREVRRRHSNSTYGPWMGKIHQLPDHDPGAREVLCCRCLKPFHGTCDA